jgi:hypothetical protein
MRRTEKYAAMTKDEAQRRRWTFYEAVILRFCGVRWALAPRKRYSSETFPFWKKGEAIEKVA